MMVVFLSNNVFLVNVGTCLDTVLLHTYVTTGECNTLYVHWEPKLT